MATESSTKIAERYRGVFGRASLLLAAACLWGCSGKVPPSGVANFEARGSFASYSGKLASLETVGGGRTLQLEVTLENLSSETVCFPSFYAQAKYAQLGYMEVRELDGEGNIEAQPLDPREPILPSLADVWQHFMVLAPQEELSFIVDVSRLYRPNRYPIRFQLSLRVFKCSYFDTNPMMSITDIVENRPIRFERTGSDFLRAEPIVFPSAS